MSLILILLTILFLLALYWRTTARAKAAIRSWAATYGYQVLTLRFEAIFSREFQENGREAELVYRAVLLSASTEEHGAYFLIWNLLWGRPSVLVRWRSVDRAEMERESRPGR